MVDSRDTLRGTAGNGARDREFLAAFQQAAELHKAGRMSEALAAYSTASRLDPQRVEPVFNVAVILMHTGRHSEAAQVARSVLQFGSVPQTVARGTALLLAGSPPHPETSQCLRSLLDVLPLDGDLKIQAAKYFRSASLLDMGRSICLDAIRNRPDFREAVDLLREIEAEIENASAVLSYCRGRNSSNAAVDIFVKAYNRPIYLDRCIQSIRNNIQNYGRIVVLNDGIGEPYYSKLKVDHPDVYFVSSWKIEAGIIASPMNDAASTRRANFRNLDHFDPAAFWVREIDRSCSEHVLIIEEDCWITRPLDLAWISRTLTDERALALWLFHENDQLKNDRSQRSDWSKRVEGGEAAIDFYKPPVPDVVGRDWVQGYKLFSIANCITHRTYWLNSYDRMLHWTDEKHANERAMRALDHLVAHGVQPVFGYLDGGALRHCTTTTSRADAGGKGITANIDPHMINDILNAAWLEGRIPAMLNYPMDFEPEFLAAILANSLPPGGANEWAKWRAEFLNKFQYLVE